jgi:hypothetical protein
MSSPSGFPQKKLYRVIGAVVVTLAIVEAPAL